MRIAEIVSSSEYGIDEQFQNCQFFELNFDFPRRNVYRNWVIFQFWKFQKLSILKIMKICNF